MEHRGFAGAACCVEVGSMVAKKFDSPQLVVIYSLEKWREVSLVQVGEECFCALLDEQLCQFLVLVDDSLS